MRAPNIDPEFYTIQVTSVAGEKGEVLVELYDVDGRGLARPINLSVRSAVSAGQPVMVPGFVTRGQGMTTLFIRAVGPGLADFGVENNLPDPVLQFYRDDEVIGSNIGWSTGDDPTGVELAGETAGAFALSPNGLDSALLMSVLPGPYTAHVSSESGRNGAVLVEVYEIY